MRTVRCSGRRGGVSARGCLPDTPPEQNDWQTLVKILPCRNYVADGKCNLTDLEVHACGSLSMEKCDIFFNTGRIQIKVLTTLSFYFSWILSFMWQRSKI